MHRWRQLIVAAAAVGSAVSGCGSPADPSTGVATETTYPRAAFESLDGHGNPQNTESRISNVTTLHPDWYRLSPCSAISDPPTQVASVDLIQPEVSAVAARSTVFVATVLEVLSAWDVAVDPGAAFRGGTSHIGQFSETVVRLEVEERFNGPDDSHVHEGALVDLAFFGCWSTDAISATTPGKRLVLAVEERLPNAGLGGALGTTPVWVTNWEPIGSDGVVVDQDGMLGPVPGAFSAMTVDEIRAAVTGTD